ncbi:MAG: hypothetical protein IJA55_06480 [Clostridia bacterium]|nr:hypothetical protein [Clostridia bacterium]
MSKGSKVFFTVISLLLLASVLFLPIYDKGGGILSEGAEYNFVRVIGDSLMVEGTLSMWVVHMTLGVFLPAVIMLASAFTGIRWIYSIANTLGIFIWLFNFFRYAFKNGFTMLIDINKTDISIGSWLAGLFLLISALVLLCTKKSKKTEPEEKDADRCPYCGIKLRGNISRCPRCQKRLKK